MENFATASRRALEFLAKQYGLGLWVVTRRESGSWIVLSTHSDGAYEVAADGVLPWSDTLCARMVSGLGPTVARDIGEVPAYAAAPVTRKMPIKAYVGYPLFHSDGSVFGTLCGIDPRVQPPSLTDQTEVIRLIADLLSEVLNAELAAEETQRRLDRTVDEARRDELTNLYNRRAWVEFLQAEEKRCRRYGHPGCVIAVDLDGLKNANDREGHEAGDRLLQTTATALLSAVRSVDVVARTGGDEFMILGIECDAPQAAAMVERIRTALADAQVQASVGSACRTPETGLYVTAHRADEAMYREKAARKTRHLRPS